MMVNTIIFVWWLSTCSAYVAYDCGSNPQQIGVYSTIDVEGDCSTPIIKPNVTQVNVQLLQLSEYALTRIIQCKIDIDRTIYHCGMHSHMSVVQAGRMNYVMDISRDQCTRLHETKSISIGSNNYMTGLKPNMSNTQYMTLAGKLSVDSNCQGVEYADPFGSWSSVVVQAIVTVTFQDSYESIRLSTNDIKLHSGMICSYSAGRCMDHIGGWTFWHLMHKDLCGFNNYEILWSGVANKIRDSASNENKAIYSLTTPDVTFAFTNEGQQQLCSYQLIKTEHPRLYIFESKNGQSFTSNKDVLIQNMDIFSYVNSKFVFTERHTRNQIATLYEDVLTQKCLLEQSVIKNALSLATIAPDEFAYNVMKGPGFMAAKVGEVVYIMKCIAIDVKIRPTKDCYHQLPVYNGNRSMFVAPKTHVLQQSGLQIDCNNILRPMYVINGQWYTVNPRFTEGKAPRALKASKIATWNYTTPKFLMTSGIYSMNELRKYRDHLMFPIERPGILNSIARTVTGQESNHDGIYISNLIEENMIEQAVKSYWDKMSSWLVRFANYMSTFVGFCSIVMIIKYLLDIMIHAYTLHGVYGWSVHIIGALWDSIAHFLIHIANRPHQPKNSPDYSQPNDIELGNTSVLAIAAPEQRVYPMLPDSKTGLIVPTAPMLSTASTIVECECDDCREQ